MVLPAYKWRGKTYKTLTGFNRAVFKVFPGCSITFGHQEMHLKWRDGSVLVFDVVREPECSTVCDHHK